MAEIGAAVVGGGFALAAAGYSAGTGFTSRHENTHAQQVAEMKRHISDFQAAYERQEVTEHDWQQFLTIRAEWVISACHISSTTSWHVQSEAKWSTLRRQYRSVQRDTNVQVSPQVEEKATSEDEKEGITESE